MKFLIKFYDARGEIEAITHHSESSFHKIDNWAQRVCDKFGYEYYVSVLLEDE